jgi:hypothetical protein
MASADPTGWGRVKRLPGVSLGKSMNSLKKGWSKSGRKRKAPQTEKSGVQQVDGLILEFMMIA